MLRLAALTPRCDGNPILADPLMPVNRLHSGATGMRALDLFSYSFFFSSSLENTDTGS